MQLTLFFFISFILSQSHRVLSSSLSSSHHLFHLSSSHLSHLPAHAVAVPTHPIADPRHPNPRHRRPMSPSPPHSADPCLRPILQSDPRHLSILFAVIEFVFFFLMYFHMGLVVVVVVVDFGYGSGGG